MTVLSPDSVIADTLRNRESVNEISIAGVDDPQKTRAEIRHVPKKYR